MLSGLTGWHFLIVLIVILLLFGATKLPALAKGLGESMRIFKTEIKKDDGTVKPGTDQATTPPNRTTSGVSENYDAPDSSSKP
jgi:sec-independent protein translocase protein TatA